MENGIFNMVVFTVSHCINERQYVIGCQFTAIPLATKIPDTPSNNDIVAPHKYFPLDLENHKIIGRVPTKTQIDETMFEMIALQITIASISKQFKIKPANTKAILENNPIHIERVTITKTFARITWLQHTGIVNKFFCVF